MRIKQSIKDTTNVVYNGVLNYFPRKSNPNHMTQTIGHQGIQTNSAQLCIYMEGLRLHPLLANVNERAP
jgi:hypothetical protein